MIKEKVKVFIIIIMVINMKANLKMIYLMVKEFIFLIMEIDMMEILKKGLMKEKEYIIIMMEEYIQDNILMVI